MRIARGALFLLLALVLPSSYADFPATYEASIGGYCPRNGQPFQPGVDAIIKKAPTCDSALSAGYSILASCDGTLFGAVCNNGLAEIDWGSGDSQAGSLPIARIRPFCPEGQFPYFYEPYGTI